jgi:hypothetical protein
MFGVTVVEPNLTAVGCIDHARCPIDELRRHPSFEHVGRFDNVIVARDDREWSRRPRRFRKKGGLSLDTLAERTAFARRIE